MPWTTTDQPTNHKAAVWALPPTATAGDRTKRGVERTVRLTTHGASACGQTRGVCKRGRGIAGSSLDFSSPVFLFFFYDRCACIGLKGCVVRVRPQQKMHLELNPRFQRTTAQLPLRLFRSRSL